MNTTTLTTFALFDHNPPMLQTDMDRSTDIHACKISVTC